MSTSPTQDILDRIDRLTNELATLSPTNAQQTTSLVSRAVINSTDPRIINQYPTNTFHSTMKPDSVVIEELQQYIRKMEREREILLRSYGIVLELLKYNDLNARPSLLEHDYSEFLHLD